MPSRGSVLNWLYRLRRSSARRGVASPSFFSHSSLVKSNGPPQPKVAAKPAFTHCSMDMRWKIGRMSWSKDGRFGADRAPTWTATSSMTSHIVRTDFSIGA